MMITVAMGDPTPGESLRGWFYRATAAQIDFQNAYQTYLTAILPRWFGNYDVMYQFALECADSGRYDTEVPLKFQEVLNDIVTDSEGDWSYWRRPGIAERSMDILNHFADSRDYSKFFRSQTVGYSWQVGRYDLARAALDKINGEYDPAGLDVAMTIPSRTVSCVYAMTGEMAPLIKDAEHAAATGDSKAAIAQYQQLAKKIKPDDPASAWIHGRPREIQLLADFDRGDWVDLIPDQSLAGWYPFDGEFSADGKTLDCKSINKPAYLLCGAKFANRYELHAVIDVQRDASGNVPEYADAGVVFDYINQQHRMELSFEPGAKMLRWKWDGQPLTDLHAGISPHNDMTIRQFDNTLEVSFNGLKWIKTQVFQPGGFRPDNRIGVGSTTYIPESKFTVIELKIRKLTEPMPIE